MKKILPVIGADNLVILGLSVTSGELAFVTYICNSRRVYLYMDSLVENQEFKDLLMTPELVIFDDFVPEAFELIYLLRSDVEGSQPRKTILPNDDSLRALYNQVEKTFASDFHSVVNEVSFVNFSYKIYCWLYARIKTCYDNSGIEMKVLEQDLLYDSDDQTIKLKLLKLDECIRKYVLNSFDLRESGWVDKCNKFLEERLHNEIKKAVDTSSIDAILPSSIEQYFKALSRIAKDAVFCEQLVEKLKANVLSEVQGKIGLLSLFSRLFLLLRYTLNKSPDNESSDSSDYDDSFDYDYISGKVSIPRFLNDTISNKIYDKMSIKNVKQVCEEYELQHFNTADHGIISSEYAASVFSSYRNAIRCANKDREKIVLSILLDIPYFSDCTSIRYIEDYDHVFLNTLFAVFIHNLYPSSFKAGSRGRDYKTAISDPFTYLALLCDALQEWNRPRSLHPALFERHPLGGPSEEYNIVIDAGKIRLSDSAVRDNRWLDNNISKLSMYLDSINSFIGTSSP